MKPELKPCKVCHQQPIRLGSPGSWRFLCVRRYYEDHDVGSATGHLMFTQKTAAEDWNKKQETL